jgi:hypothetical protein
MPSYGYGMLTRGGRPVLFSRFRAHKHEAKKARKREEKQVQNSENAEREKKSAEIPPFAAQHWKRGFRT